MPRGDQLARQWQLLQLIDHPAGIAVEDAARKLDCTVRTIWRVLEVLERAGFPLYSDKKTDGCRSIWKLQEDFKLGLSVKLSLAETAALLSNDVEPRGVKSACCFKHHEDVLDDYSTVQHALDLRYRIGMPYRPGVETERSCSYEIRRNELPYYIGTIDS